MTDEIRLEGFTLAVEDVSRSVEFYDDKLGLMVEANRAPVFACRSTIRTAIPSRCTPNKSFVKRATRGGGPSWGRSSAGR